MNKFICIYCLEHFKNSNLLLKHQKTSKHCINYSKVLFVCENCNFTTKGIKNIDKHINENNCKNNQETNLIFSDDENEYIFENSDEENTNINIEEEITLQNQIIKLETELKKEKIKTNIYIEIIDKFKNNGFNTNTPQINIDIPQINTDISYKNIQENSPCNSDSKSVEDSDSKNIYKNYKTLKNNQIDNNKVENIGNKIEDIEKHIKEIDYKYYCMRHNFGNIEQCKMKLKQEFDYIRDNRNYNKNLENIKNIRRSLIGSMPIDDYISLVEEHDKLLYSILELKGHQIKKIPSIIFKSLNTLDMRFIHYETYYDRNLDTDEYSKLKTALEIFKKCSLAYYSPFVFDDFIKRFFNYGTILTPLKTCIEYYLFNRYGFNSIIYVPLKQSSSEDPFSFYILESISKDKKYWKMDCRLFELTENIINSLKQYFVGVFRKIYQTVYKDNDYRDCYLKLILFSTDCHQLLQNLFLLNNKKLLCNYIRELVKDRSTYLPTINDKFNLYGDDVIIKKRILKDKENDIVDLIKLLFDNITSEQAIDLYRNNF